MRTLGGDAGQTRGDDSTRGEELAAERSEPWREIAAGAGSVLDP